MKARSSRLKVSTYMLKKCQQKWTLFEWARCWGKRWSAWWPRDTLYNIYVVSYNIPAATWDKLSDGLRSCFAFAHASYALFFVASPAPATRNRHYNNRCCSSRASMVILLRLLFILFSVVNAVAIRSQIHSSFRRRSFTSHIITINFSRRNRINSSYLI